MVLLCWLVPLPSLKAPFVYARSRELERLLLSAAPIDLPISLQPHTPHPHSLPLLYEDFVEARGRFCVAVGLIPASDQASG